MWRHPWRRSYHKRRKAQWETDADYCTMVSWFSSLTFFEFVLNELFISFKLSGHRFALYRIDFEEKIEQTKTNNKNVSQNTLKQSTVDNQK